MQSINYDNDKYLGFEFRGKHSKDFNAFIINEGEDLRFYNPSFEVEAVTPQFGGLTHYLGTTINSRELSFTVFAKEVDIDTYNKMISAWFNEKNEPAYLAFDYNPNFGYKCVVSDIGDATFTVSENCDVNKTTYNVTFNITFTTVGDWAAHYFKELTGNKIEEGEVGEEITLELSDRDFPTWKIEDGPFWFETDLISIEKRENVLPEISIYNKSSLPMFIIINFNGGSFFSQWGIVINEENEFYNLSYQPKKIQIEPNSGSGLDRVENWEGLESIEFIIRTIV